MPLPAAGPRRVVGPLLIGMLLGVALALGGATLFGPWPPPPGDDSADAGFARDMAEHHAQAIEMAFIVRDATTNATLRVLTYDIIATQGAQRGIFMGWLQQWGLSPSSSGPPMAWMAGHGTAGGGSGHEAGHVRMHGMATREELDRLRAATGVDAEIQFLQLMIRHHEGGVIMARAVLPLTRREEVRAMARSIDETQLAEVQLMTELLAERGAQPLPSLLQ